MFLDSKDISVTSISSDICIVGAGVAGISIAREFINSKIKVVVLESGSFEPDSELQSLNTGHNKGLSYHNLEDTRDRIFGGTSYSWRVSKKEEGDGNLVRLRDLDAIDFEKREWVPYSGWPFSKSDLSPYYERAQKVFKIGPYRYDAEFWKDDRARPKINFNDEAAHTAMFQFGRKDVFLSDYKEELSQKRNIKVYLNTTALKLKVNEYANKINSISATSLEGKKLEIKSQCFILAMGGLENPRFMLLSNDRIKSGIGNQNDLVGRFFMEHPHLWSGVFYPKKNGFFENNELYNIHHNNNTPVMGKLALSEEVIREEKIMGNTASLHLSPMHALKKQVIEIHEVMQSFRKGKIEKELLSNLKKIFGNPILSFDAAVKKLTKTERYDKKRKYHGFLLNIMSEQSPDPESRVTLSRDEDRFGQKRIALHWKLNSSDVRSIKKFQEILDRKLRKSSIGHLDLDHQENKILEKIHGGWHHMGTTRMDNDPKRGVVDENCKVHGIDNLFIAGSSVFPTSGYANPTLTIVAMALRLADYLKKNKTSLVHRKN